MNPQPRSMRDRLLEMTIRHHRYVVPVRIVLDVVAVCSAIAVAVYLRLSLSLRDDAGTTHFWRVVPVIIGLQIISGFAFGLYRGKWRYGSYDEVAALCATVITSTAALYLLNEHYLDGRPIPQSAVLVGGLFGLVMMAGIRYAWRLLLEKLRRPNERNAEKMLVFGAGEAGVQIVTTLLRSPSSRYLPVGFLDDSPSKKRLSIMGVPILGDRTDLDYAADRTGATTLLIAIPAADAKMISELTALADEQGLRVKVLPSVEEVIDGRVSPSDIRDLTDEDLLGRRQLDTDIESIASYIAGRRVLITGAGGSIGSELSRQISRLGPSELIMLDRDESALHQVEMSIHGRSLLDTDETVLADIRDLTALADIFENRRPDVVFHAAALKHLPLLERFAAEAFKTNVIGTHNVLHACETVGVSVVVNVSSDKAANPSSVLGYSKRVAERITADYGQRLTGSRYLSVRFGNVLGSRGSVLGIFQNQISKGLPVTITDPGVTRYFMTIPEAVQLVIQAGAIGESGEVLILDMGEPVMIYDLARRMIARSGYDIDIEFTGLRSGEKLHEELLGDGETDSRPKHRLISHAKVPPLDPAELTEPPLDLRERMIQLS
jgi:FlaA1/EpsC-like NDP-sugar epimerase